MIMFDVLRKHTAIGLTLLVFSRVQTQSNAHEPIVIESKAGPICILTFSPDSKMLATGCENGTVKVFQIPNKHEVGDFSEPTKRDIHLIRFSKDAKSLMVGCVDSFRTWNMASKKQGVLKGFRGSSPMAINSDGKVLITADAEGAMKMVGLPTGKELGVFRGHKGQVSSVALSADGKLLASGARDHKVKIWDLASRKEVATLDKHKEVVHSVAFSPDGSTLASASADQTVMVWDIDSKKAKLVLQAKGWGGVACVNYSPDGKWICTGSADGSVRIWDAAKGKERVVLRGHKDLVWYVAFSPDGKWIASGSDDKTARLWDITRTLSDKATKKSLQRE
jgi:WD40 repeat protein